MPEPDSGSFTDRSLPDRSLSDIVALIPASALEILDLRCGAGELGGLLAARNPAVTVTGVEADPASASAARDVLAEVFVGRADTVALPFAQRSLDAVVALEAAERVVDPWQLMRQVHGWLKVGGTFVARVSNAANAGFLAGAAEGRWHYGESGMLDRDRLRFFTRESFATLLEESGMTVNNVIPVGDEESFVFVATKPPSTGPVFRRSISVDVSVILAVHNGADDAARLVGSLAAVEQNASVEVVLVDNASTDSLAQVEPSESAGIAVVRNIADLGVARALAQGAAAAKGRCLLFLDPSVTLGPGCLGALITALDNVPQLAAVGPVITDPTGTVVSAGLSVTLAGADPVVERCWAGMSIDELDVQWGQGRVEVDAFESAAMGFRRTIFESLEGFDLGLKNGPYDVDMCLRLGHAGWKIMCETSARVVLHRPVDMARFAAPDAVSELARRWGGSPEPR